MTKRIKFLGSSLLISFVVFAGAIIFWKSSVPGIGTIEPSFIYDPSDDKEVVGAFHNVFTGKVITNLGTTPYDAIPQTQYTVEVAYNVKGNLKEGIIVSQLGGYKDGVLYRLNMDGGLYASDAVQAVDGEDITLRVGSTYLFATRYNPDMNWHVLSSHPSGVKLISTDASLTTDQIIKLSAQDQRVRELQEAYKNEVIPLPDLKSGNVPRQY